MDLLDRILELSRENYYCAQILAILLLETLGEENPGLIKAMGGLNGGVGFSGGCCGCLTGGACILSYVTGKGVEDYYDHPANKPVMGRFTRWFEDEIGSEYGGMDCRDIIRGNPAKRVEYCPQIIAATYETCMELLSERGLL